MLADRVTITVLVDNYVDIFLPSDEKASYPLPGRASRLWAEQGLSLWVEVWSGSQVRRILYDFGRSDRVLLHNAGILGIDVALADYCVLSHGHVDHYGSLKRVLKLTRPACRVLLHPCAVGSKRFIRLKNGADIGPWEVPARYVASLGPRVTLSTEPLELFPGAWVSGQIPRRTEYEKGMPNAMIRKEGRLIHDDIADDQALFVNLQGKGVVVITGCCHAGIVNTIMHAETIFPNRNIHAVVGGLHLNSADERQMGETIAYLASREIAHLSALHCTGYFAQRRLMEVFRRQWIPATVGACLSL